jgi:hypothetical protein
MRIGVVSDTHNHLANVGRIVELFEAEAVDRVVHTGDITQPKTLRVFGRLRVPWVGVYGNNDEREALAEAARELGFQLFEPPLELCWAGRRILVVHDPLDVERHLKDHELVLHGHDHCRRLEWRSGCLVFNPGECAGHLPGRNAVGVVDLSTLEARIVEF